MSQPKPSGSEALIATYLLTRFSIPAARNVIETIASESLPPIRHAILEALQDTSEHNEQYHNLHRRTENASAFDLIPWTELKAWFEESSRCGSQAAKMFRHVCEFHTALTAENFASDEKTQQRAIDEFYQIRRGL
jgi:hypothetical protein